MQFGKEWFESMVDVTPEEEPFSLEAWNLRIFDAQPLDDVFSGKS